MFKSGAAVMTLSEVHQTWALIALVYLACAAGMATGLAS